MGKKEQHHGVQEDILKLSKTEDLSRLPLRATAERLGVKMSPGNLQHHFAQLEKRGLLFVDRKSKVQRHGDVLLQVHTMPDGRDIAYIPFNTYKIVDIDGQKAIISLDGGHGE